MNRVARVERLTRETQIMVELDLDGIGVVEVGTGVAPDPRAGGIPSTKGVLA